MTDHIKHNDPLDDLLYAAFERDMADVNSADISAQVIKRLQRRLRLRAAVLGLCTFVGLSLMVAFALPSLTKLLESAQPLSPSLTAVLPVLALGALAPWLFTMVDDRI